MNRMLTKKISLLLHLAKIDGHFADSEKALLVSILKDLNLDESSLEQYHQDVIDLKGISLMDDKAGLLYSMLKLIHADGHVHLAEIAYAERIASELQYKKDIVRYFVERPLPSWMEFQELVNHFSVNEIA